MKFERKYPISVAIALERGVISKIWGRGYNKYFWYADGGSDNGHDTALEALAEYYDVVVPARTKRETLEAKRDAESKLQSGTGFPVHMDTLHDTVEYLNPITNTIEIVSVRKFRQILFDLEDEFDMEVVYIDTPLIIK